MHHKAGDNPFLRTTVDAFDTFMFTPKETTHGKGVHIRDGMDLKRTMIMVVLPLTLLYLFGAWNIGHHHYLVAGMAEEATLLQKFLYGLLQIIPTFIVVHAVGLGIEFLFAAKKGHSVEEGFLVSGALIPLIMPPGTPLWMTAIAVAFAVIFAKEAFGGTGMNIWNVALMARVFVFFAYPAAISGDVTPVLDDTGKLQSKNYVWIENDHNLLHNAFGNFFKVNEYDAAYADMILSPDAISGATPLAVAATGLEIDGKEYVGWEAVQQMWTTKELLFGIIPGSVGEMFKPLILLGAIFLVLMGVGSWRIMVSFAVGAAIAGIIMNVMPGASDFMKVPFQYQFLMGSLLFALAFMATDPVTAAQTNMGKLWYGFLIGFVGMIVRVINPAYPEGWMLAILFMNTFAPLIDHMVLSRNIKRRMAHATN
ncbi:MAG: NADH:ubiquinone reductase (Na(+)-transporting) subunit B [Saprospiraceae bacterium]|nr:NADH:ubiquinone reductase (Na(+)-transporting) subunit B [Saprospiraceae bacterium]